MAQMCSSSGDSRGDSRGAFHASDRLEVRERESGSKLGIVGHHPLSRSHLHSEGLEGFNTSNACSGLFSSIVTRKKKKRKGKRKKIHQGADLACSLTHGLRFSWAERVSDLRNGRHLHLHLRAPGHALHVPSTSRQYFNPPASLEK